MAEFVAWARERFDIVIFDSAPSLAVTDAILLGRLADGVVLCLRAGYVQKKDAKLCRDRLLQSELRMLGVVLNCDRGVGGTYRGRYRGGYAYEAAYGQADEVPEKAAS